MHDIGKFIFPDRILKTDTKLTEEDWQIIKMHPYQGAKVVREMEGYGPVGDIILAHHERFGLAVFPAQGDQVEIDLGHDAGDHRTVDIAARQAIQRQ